GGFVVAVVLVVGCAGEVCGLLPEPVGVVPPAPLLDRAGAESALLDEAVFVVFGLVVEGAPVVAVALVVVPLESETTGVDLGALAAPADALAGAHLLPVLVVAVAV